MKCKKCNEKAALHMRQHKLALCKTHFLQWIQETTDRIIQKYEMFTRVDRILAAVSGGKDSLVLWHVLTLLGYSVDGLYIDLGIGEKRGYSATSLHFVRKFAEEKGLPLQVFDVEGSYGASIPTAAKLSRRGQGKPCSLCGLTKRHVMNRVAREGGYDVLVTGHNLDDEAAQLFGNTLNWHTGYLAKQGPVLEGTTSGLVRKAKPFCRFYERETAAYAFLAEIDYIYDECPHAKGAKSIYYKETLNRLEADRPGAKTSFYLSFLRAKSEGAFSHFPRPDLESLPQCPSCGQATSAPSFCAFCRMWEKVKQEMGNFGEDLAQS
jgi:uncharacterized protein (TIGR00269 family)